jgi:DNA-binding transcriptional LysR family regulator
VHLGVRLLDRTARGVFATSFGEALVNHTRFIDSELERAEVAIEMLKGGVAGHIRCGGTIGPMNWLLPAALKELRKNRPRIRVRIVEGIPPTLMAMLRLGELDVIVCSKTDDLPELDLIGHMIGTDQIDIFAGRGHWLHDEPHNALSVLVDSVSWILPDASGAFYKTIQAEFERRALDMPKLAIETSSSVMLRALLRSTDCVAITTTETLMSDLKDGSINRLHIDWTPIPTNTIAYHRADSAPAPATTSLIRNLQRAAHRRPYGQFSKAAPSN